MLIKKHNGQKNQALQKEKEKNKVICKNEVKF